MEQKIGLYLTEGVRGVWIVDPKRQHIFCDAAGESVQEVTERDTLILPDPLQGTILASDIFLLDY